MSGQIWQQHDGTGNGKAGVKGIGFVRSVLGQVTESPRLWIVAFAAVYVIWGSTYLAIRFAIETLPPAGSRHGDARGR